MTPLWVPEHFGHLPKLHVYIDETGDRGFSEASRTKSPFFAMSALAVPGEDEVHVKVAAGGLRALVHTRQPQDKLKPIHWVEHFKPKRADRRRAAAVALAAIPTAKVIHVIAHKDTLHMDAGMRTDKELFYNYTTRLVLERVAHLAKDWPGGPRLAIVRLGRVKHMDHATSEAHLDFVRGGSTQTFGVPWAHIKWPPSWENTERDGIQLADIHAGMLNAALSGNQHDAACAQYFLMCAHQLRRGPRGTLLGYGIKVIGDSSFITDRVWWNDLKSA